MKEAEEDEERSGKRLPSGQTSDPKEVDDSAAKPFKVSFGDETSPTNGPRNLPDMRRTANMRARRSSSAVAVRDACIFSRERLALDCVVSGCVRATMPGFAPVEVVQSFCLGHEIETKARPSLVLRIRVVLWMHRAISRCGACLLGMFLFLLQHVFMVGLRCTRTCNQNVVVYGRLYTEDCVVTVKIEALCHRS